ncbi:MAG TPA: DUF3795 domain-containing protein [Bacillota bacterium]|nr:DUF3795 domain-containing protein [Bacillota bacterium]
MSTKNEKLMVAPCGLSCGHCRLHLAKDDPAMREWLRTNGFNPESYPCAGCRTLDGKVSCSKPAFEAPKVDGRCATYACVVEHGVDFCYECQEFPCAKLQPCADKARELPHNMKVFYLTYIQKYGLTKFLADYPGLGMKYYFGTMVVGLGPQLSANDLADIRAKLGTDTGANKA